MHATAHDPSRTGARWVAATGAFLLFAAAVVFVAVRWSEIPDSLKLAALGTLTASCLVAGQSTRRVLPATSTTLFHLGLFLLPVNVAAALVRSDLSSDAVLLATGLVAVSGFVLGAQLERSALLRWAAGVATIAVARGAAGVLPVPDQFELVAPGAVITALLAEVAVRARPRPLQVTAAVSSTVPPIVVAVVIVFDTDPAVVLAGLTATAWLLALRLDAARLGGVARAASLLLLPCTLAISGEATVAVLTGAYAALAVLDAIRRDEPDLAVGAVLAGPIAIYTALVALGLETDEAGLGLTIAAVVPAGLVGLVPSRWHLSLGLGAGLAGAWGLAIAHLDPSTGATALLVAGALLGLIAVVGGQPVLAPVGLVVGSIGYWSHLDQAGVASADAYVLPVALALLLIGGALRQRNNGHPVSSWIAYAPAVALLGGTALVERIDDGLGRHALVAGAVGVVAVVLGGRFRLIGPLVVGTALLVSLCGYESLAVTAGVPTWAWLALGGAVLLTAGIAMDRADTGPVDASRRLADVVSERFS